MMNHHLCNIASELAVLLEEANIPYEFTEAASLGLQGMEVPKPFPISIHIQWDLFEEAYDLFKLYGPSHIERTPLEAGFHFQKDDMIVEVSCRFNTTIRTNPYRIAVQIEAVTVWCRSLYAYLYFPENEVYANYIHHSLRKEQQELTSQNEQAWNQNNYTALINRYGEPAEVAKKIQQNPEWRLYPFAKYLKNISGKKAIHLMGSNGVKGTALSLLGADVTIVDFSRENAAFATELAKQAGVSITYIVSDVLSVLEKSAGEKYDIVVMELGVLHYFIDLQPLFQVVHELLHPDGQFILHEFHPISTKLITSTGKKHKVTGNYFNPSIERGEVAFSKHMPEEEKASLTKVLQRKWTLGELVTVVAQAGLMIQVLEEEPNHKVHDIGLPKTFTLVAEKR